MTGKSELEILHKDHQKLMHLFNLKDMYKTGKIRQGL